MFRLASPIKNDRESIELNEISAKKTIETVLELGSKYFDGVEASLVGSDVSTSRFAESQMTQNQSPEQHKLSLRVLKDGRQIRMDSSDTSLSGMRELVNNANRAVKFSEPDPDLQEILDSGSGPSNEGQETSVPDRLDPMVKRMSAGQRAVHVGNIVQIADEAGLTAAGVVASGTHFEAVGNSRGLFRYHEETHAECSVTMVNEDSSGWAKSQSPRLSDVDPGRLARIAADKAKGASSPADIVPGKYTAILEPSAVLDLMGFLLWDFAATSHRDRQTCLLGRMGEKVFGDNINIRDDVYDPRQAGAAFDAEGVSRKRVSLVENGRLVDLVYGRRSASLSGKQATGHGLAEPSGMGEYPHNLVMDGGEASLENMIESTDQGILLSRVWYVRTVDPARKILTGMTRDGTFKVENGAIVNGVKNLRFNISLLELLNQVEILGVPVRAAGEETGPAVVPAMKVAAFNFTEVTRF